MRFFYQTFLVTGASLYFAVPTKDVEAVACKV